MRSGYSLGASALATRQWHPQLKYALLLLLAANLSAAWPVGLCAAEESAANWLAEEETSLTLPEEVRVYANSPRAPDPAGRSRVVLYALPNGNTLEQTLGCRQDAGLDWHYDIQHVAAQVRLLRSLDAGERMVLVLAEAGGLSWPSWRGGRADGNARIGALLEQWRRQYGGLEARVTLTGHSGGGSFIFGVIEAFDQIPDYIDRIALLDANYAFDRDKHAAKLADWLTNDASRRLIVLAYDDRNIEYEGKKVVGPDGGTFRATGRMREAFAPQFPWAESKQGPFDVYTALDGRLRFYVHPNPENKILHTALVGDMNGLVHAQTLGTPAEGAWGTFGGPRAYERFVQAEPTTLRPQPPADGESADSPAGQIPARPPGARGGRELLRGLAAMSHAEREAAILQEIVSGNIPDFLRRFVAVPVAAGEHRGTIDVAPDYLAVGSDEDFVRVPMNPHTAQAIADRFGCTLPTRKMVDLIDAAAEVRLAPQPLTEDRESVAAFLLSNERIEQQRGDRPLGALTTGAKKDVVLSPRIFERPNRVVIYGWRRSDGTVIQPLTNVHVDWYVDYSHGVRLVRDRMELDGQTVGVAEVLQDAARCAVISDEGPIDRPRYPAAGE